MSHAVLIFGNHRTGSSALARMVEGLGYDLGGPGYVNAANPYGHFEDVEFYDICRRLTGELHGNPAAWTNPPYWSDAVPAAIAAELAALVQRRQAKPRWGLKNPRMLSFFQAMLTQLPDASIIVTRRPLCEIATSLHHRDGKHYDARRAIQIATRYDEFQDALQRTLAATDRPFCTVHFDELFEHPMAVAGRLAQFLDVPYREEAANAIDPALRHWSAARMGADSA